MITKFYPIRPPKEPFRWRQMVHMTFGCAAIAFGVTTGVMGACYLVLTIAKVINHLVR